MTWRPLYLFVVVFGLLLEPKDNFFPRLPRQDHTIPEKTVQKGSIQSEKKVVLAQAQFHQADEDAARENQVPATTPSFTRPSLHHSHRRHNGDYGSTSVVEMHQMYGGAQQIGTFLPKMRRKEGQVHGPLLQPKCALQLPHRELGTPPELVSRMERLEWLATMGCPRADYAESQGPTAPTFQRSTSTRWQRFSEGEKRRWERQERQGKREGKESWKGDGANVVPPSQKHTDPTACTAQPTAFTAPGESHPEAADYSSQEKSRPSFRRRTALAARGQCGEHAELHQTDNSCGEGVRQSEAEPATGTRSPPCPPRQLETFPHRRSWEMGSHGCRLRQGRGCHAEEHKGSTDCSRQCETSSFSLQAEYGGGDFSTSGLLRRRASGDGHNSDHRIGQHVSDNETATRASRSLCRRGPEGRQATKKARQSWCGWRKWCRIFGFAIGRQDVTTMYAWQRPNLSGSDLMLKWLHPIVEQPDFVSPWQASWQAFLDVGFDQDCLARASPWPSLRSTTRTSGTTSTVKPPRSLHFSDNVTCHVWPEDFPKHQVTIPLTHEVLHEWSDKPWGLRAPEADDDEVVAMQRPLNYDGRNAITSNPSTPIYDWKRFVLEQVDAAMRWGCSPAFKYQTWYIDHRSHTHCLEPRIWKLDEAPFDWERQLRKLWYDVIDALQPLRIHMVSPHLRQSREHDDALGHIVLVQGSQDYAAVVLSSPQLEGLHYRALTIAASTFRRSEGRHLLRLAGMSQQCDELQCTIWLYPHRLPLRQPVALHDGAHIEIVPAFGPGTAQSFHDGSEVPDHVSWLQTASTTEDLHHSKQGPEPGECVPLSDYLAVSNCPGGPNGFQTPPQEGSVKTLPGYGRHDGRPSTPWYGAARYTQPTTSHPWNTGEHPEWTTEVWLQLYVPQAEENRRGIETIEVYTWFLDDELQTRCERDRPLELGPDWWQWDQQVRHAWRDKIQAHKRLGIHIAFSEPPRDSLELHQGHLLIEQIENGNKATLVTALYETTGANRLWRSAFTMTPHVNKVDVLSTVPHLDTSTAPEFLVFWHENIIDEHFVLIPHGASLIIHKSLDPTTRRALADTRRADDDDDLLHLMAHQIDLRPGQVPIIDDIDIARDPEDLDDAAEYTESEESQSEDFGYDRNVDPDTTWRSVIIFTRDGEGIVGRAQETHPELCHREYAHMLSITPNSLLQVHDIQSTPPDIAAAGQEAVVAQQLHDLVPGSNGRMVLVDVIFCNHLPTLDVETVRQIKVLCTPIDRCSLLRLLRLERYSNRPGQACLLHHNGALLNTQRGAAFTVEHGDYIRVTVPPAARHGFIDTRLAVLAHFHNLAEAAYPHLMRQIPENMNIMQVPNPAILLDNLNEADETAMVQLMQQEVHLWKTHSPPVNQDLRLFGDPLCELRATQQHQREHEAQQLTWNMAVTDVQPAFQAIMTLPAYLALNGLPDPDGCLIQTWYISHERARRCNIPRVVHLGADVTGWHHQIQEAWSDEIDPTHETTYHFVHPQPYEMEQGILAHLILKQHELPGEVGVHVTLFDPGVREGRPVRFVEIHGRFLNHHELLDMADRDRACQLHEVTCRTWCGWSDITNEEPFMAFNGQSFAITVVRHNEPLLDHTAWDGFAMDETSWLQKHHSLIPTLRLQDLVPEPRTVVFTRPSSLQTGFPQYIEVPFLHNSTAIDEELQRWGFQCTSFQFGAHDEYFCELVHDQTGDDLIHYMYSNEDVNDKEGCIMHSSPLDMNEKEHMRILHQLGYIRAAITTMKVFSAKVRYISFCENWGTMADNMTKHHVPTWPEPMPAISDQTPPSKLLDDIIMHHPDCRLELPGKLDDIRDLLTCATDCITQDTTGLDLPDFVLGAIQQSSRLQNFDRLVIYTDGSSQSNARRTPPDQGLDPDEVIDAWAFAVLGETYGTDRHEGTLTFLGWHTQQVLYNPASPHHVGAEFSGSHVVEREALLWAMIWRIGIDSNIPTVFRPDSRVTGAQANGTCGAATSDYSFKMLRSTFQILESMIPGRMVRIEWTPGHCGDPWNELVDIAAKTEGKRSFYMPRLRVDLRTWEDKWFHLWMIFEQQAGLPRLTAHGFDLAAPELPARPPPSTIVEKTTKTDKHERTANLRLSMATGNVNSLYTGPTGHAGKLNYLREQVRASHLNLLGLQESRAERCSSTQQQVLRLAGGSSQGKFGVELWVNMAQPYGDAQGRPLLFSEHHFAVVHADPRMMLVNVHTDHVHFWVLVAHAPQSGQTAHARHAWWESLHQMLHLHLDGHPIYGLLDANSGCGPKDGIHVFADGPVTPNTEDLRNFLNEFDLYLPSTTDRHQGIDETWTSPDGNTSARIDYVVLPCATGPFCTYSQVLDQFDLGQLYDHRPVAAELQWCQPFTTPGPPPRTMHQAYCRGQISGKDLLQDVQVSPWATDIETHVEAFNAQVHGNLRLLCKAGPASAKKGYMTEELWTLRADKLNSRQLLKCTRRQLSCALLRQCFAAWIQGTASDTEAVNLKCAQIKHLANFHLCNRRLRKRLRMSKQNSLNQAFAKMPDKASSSYILQVVKEHSGPTNLKKIQKRPLPIIEDEQGVPCVSPEQALNRWIQFFCDMEGGERMDPECQRNLWIDHLEQFKENEFHLDVQSLPALVDYEAAFRRVANGKATGPDGIPSEACRYNAAGMAKTTYTQLLKLLTHGQESLSHKGGRLVKAWKGKGSQSTCSAYRSLLISNHTGKVIHRALRMHQATLFESYLQSQQLGGRRRVPVQLGLHLARSFQRWQIADGQNHAILFLDLQEAFYRVLRPLALDCAMTDEQVATIVRRLGLGPHAMHELLQHLQQDPAIAEANLHWTQRKAATAIHADTHFWMDHQTDTCVTRVGSRPGDCFADLIFSYAWGRILRKYEDSLREADILTYVPHQQVWSPYECSVTTHMMPFLGPCWMDDIAICLTGDDCQDLVTKAGIASGMLIELCEAHGMCPNLKPGKTEIILAFKGRGSRAMKRKFYKPGEPAPLPVLCEDKICHLQVTGSYLHLGNVLHHSGKSGLELRRRIAIGQQAFSQRRKLLFHNQTLAWERRHELFGTLILSKILYGSETWTLVDHKSVAYFHAAILRLYKRLLKRPPDDPATDAAILAAGDFVAPDTLLRRQRLRYLGVLHACHETAHWGLLSQDLQWQALVQQDLQWMFAQLDRASDLPDPSVNFAAWRNIIQQHPKYWKRLVNRAVRHETRQRARDQEVLRFHKDIFDTLSQHGELTSPAPSSRPRLNFLHYGCMLCQTRCRSKAGESVHMCKAHGQVAPQRCLFEGTQCPICLKEYFSHAKLSNHLRNNQACRLTLHGRHQAYRPEPGHGSLTNTAQERAHDGLCPPLPAEGPHLPERPGPEPLPYDMDFYERLVEIISVTTEHALMTDLREAITTHPISWTQLLLVLHDLKQNFTEADAEVCDLSPEQVHQALEALCDPAAWPLFKGTKEATSETTAHDLSHYETWMQHLLDQESLWKNNHQVERPIARERIVLHAFSGRRRVGDVQYYLDQLQERHGTCIVIMVSVDIIIDETYGDVSRATTRDFWLHAIRMYWVIGFLGGPPCNTWSRARGRALHDRSGPRIVRTNADPWGLPSLRLRELEDVILGNVLLCFAIEALCNLALTGGIGLLEHPCEPEDESLASIWRLFVMHVLLQIPGVQLLRVAQGLYGAPSPKPTDLLIVNMPNFRHDLHGWRLAKELPKATTIGRSDSGQFRTSSLKEYPPALCCGIAEGIWNALSGKEHSASISIPDDFLTRCTEMQATEFGAFMGPDLAGHT